MRLSGAREVSALVACFLGGTDINATIHHSLKTSAALIHGHSWITRIDCRAIGMPANG